MGLGTRPQAINSFKLCLNFWLPRSLKSFLFLSRDCHEAVRNVVVVVVVIVDAAVVVVVVVLIVVAVVVVVVIVVAVVVEANLIILRCFINFVQGVGGAWQWKI